MKELFSGSDGLLSSKRVGGFVGLFLMLGLAIWGVWHNPDIFIDTLQVWAMLVGGLLGIGVAEGIMQGKRPSQAQEEGIKGQSNGLA